jgi:hypothetical protein
MSMVRSQLQYPRNKVIQLKRKRKLSQNEGEMTIKCAVG